MWKNQKFSPEDLGVSQVYMHIQRSKFNPAWATRNRGITNIFQKQTRLKFQRDLESREFHRVLFLSGNLRAPRSKLKIHMQKRRFIPISAIKEGEIMSGAQVAEVIGKSAVAITMVVAGIYVLMNGNHYILCPVLILTAYGVMTDSPILSIKG